MSGVIVDTCMWSLALRGKTPKNTKVAEELIKLIDENRAKTLAQLDKNFFLARVTLLVIKNCAISYDTFLTNKLSIPITNRLLNIPIYVEKKEFRDLIPIF